MLGWSKKGNCSHWSSNGLVKAELIDQSSHWPTFFWFKLLYKHLQENPDNVNVVSYRGLKYGKEPKGSLMYPFYWLSNGYSHIWDMDKFANIVFTCKNKNKKENKGDGENEWSYDLKKNKGIQPKWRDLMDNLDNIFKKNN